MLDDDHDIIGLQIFREFPESPTKLTLFVKHLQAPHIKKRLDQSGLFPSALQQAPSIVRFCPRNRKNWRAVANPASKTPTELGNYSSGTLRYAIPMLMSHRVVKAEPLALFNSLESPAGITSGMPAMVFEVTGRAPEIFLTLPSIFRSVKASVFGYPASCNLDKLIGIKYVPLAEDRFQIELVFSESLPDHGAHIQHLISRMVPLWDFAIIEKTANDMEIYVRTSRKGMPSQIYGRDGILVSTAQRMFGKGCEPRDLYIFEIAGQKIRKHGPHVAFIASLPNTPGLQTIVLFHLLHNLFAHANLLLKAVCRILVRKSRQNDLELVWILGAEATDQIKAEDGPSHLSAVMMALLWCCGIREPSVEVTWMNPINFERDTNVIKERPLQGYSTAHGVFTSNFRLVNWRDEEEAPNPRVTDHQAGVSEGMPQKIEDCDASRLAPNNDPAQEEVLPQPEFSAIEADNNESSGTQIEDEASSSMSQEEETSQLLIPNVTLVGNEDSAPGQSLTRGVLKGYCLAFHLNPSIVGY